MNSKINTVLITGASAGIGKALAFEFAARGANLVLIARREDLLTQIRKEIVQNFSSNVFTVAADVTKPEELQRAVQEANATLGDIDTVIVNAGFGILGHAADLTTSDFQKQFDVNVFGAINTLQATIANLRKTKGRLCFIGSTQSYLTTPNATAYCMSKFALRSLAEGLYLELHQEGVAVTLINPGFIKTDIRKGKDGKDPIPEFLMMKAEVAAQKIANAVQARKRERALTAHSQIGIWMARFLPGLTAFLLRERRKIA